MQYSDGFYWIDSGGTTGTSLYQLLHPNQDTEGAISGGWYGHGNASCLLCARCGIWTGVQDSLIAVEHTSTA